MAVTAADRDGGEGYLKVWARYGFFPLEAP